MQVHGTLNSMRSTGQLCSGTVGPKCPDAEQQLPTFGFALNLGEEHIVQCEDTQNPWYRPFSNGKKHCEEMTWMHLLHTHSVWERLHITSHSPLQFPSDQSFLIQGMSFFDAKKNVQGNSCLSDTGGKQC